MIGGGSMPAWAQRITGSPDVMVALVLIAAIAMMIVPLPTLLVDILIGMNFGIAVLMLMTAVYLKHPIEFSVLPGIIVISTVFRLALSITTTRLILAEGEAGAMIQTFGEFVVAGNVAVGMVIFLIITIVQFIVIAKGSERVAEVAARFTLDALPGKQMSIDAEMRNGDITQVEARAKRGRLERESQLYGAMDGAMKFVKGDAIAGLIIILINLIGGIGIGVAQRGLPIGEAIQIYSLLTVGDALISQIPALLVSITAATIVTRVTGEAYANLGSDISKQIASNPKALRLAAVTLAGMALLPGFPSLVLLALAGGFWVTSVFRKKAQDNEAREEAAASGTGAAGKPGEPAGPPPDPRRKTGGVIIELLVSEPVHAALGEDMIQRQLTIVRSAINEQLGIACPAVVVRTMGGTDHRFRVDMEDVPLLDEELRLNSLLLDDDVAHLELVNVPFERVGSGADETIWIDDSHAGTLADAGIGFVTPVEHLGQQVEKVLRKNAAAFLGIQETKQLLSRMEESLGDLVREVTRTSPIQRVADVLRRLLDEGISIRNTRIILEALAEWGEKEHNPVLLTEYVRAALKRQICFPLANAQRVIAVCIFERETEDLMRQALRETAVGTYLALDDRASEYIVGEVRKQVAAAAAGGKGRFAILASLDVRRFVRGLIVKNGLDIPVLSYQDIAEGFTMLPIGSVSLKAARSG